VPYVVACVGHVNCKFEETVHSSR